jgi:hypothetical protein
MDLLVDGGRPKRLVYHKGRWALDVVRLIAVGNSVFQPHVQRLEGSDAILGYLGKSESGRNLLQSAYELFRAPSSEDKRSFDNVEGQWIPSAIAPSYVKDLARQKRKTSRSHAAIEIVELRAELMLMRASYERLKQRVRELEHTLTSGVRPVAQEAPAPTPARSAPAVAPPSSVAPYAPAVPSSVPLRSASQPAPQGHQSLPFDATQQLFLGGVPTPALDGVPAASLPPPSERSAKARLRLPSIGALANCLKQALGDDVSLKESKSHLDLESGDPIYFSKLVDDTNQEVGMLLADHAATIHMSAALLMLPQAEINSQLSKPALSEDTAATMSEVFNMLCNTINKVHGNVHVRTTYLDNFEPGKVDWVSPSNRALWVDDSFGGKLAVLAR